MAYNTGKLLFIFIVAMGLSLVGAWWVALVYRQAMRRLMSAPVAAPRTGAVVPTAVSPTQTLPVRPSVAAAPPEPLPVRAADNRRAGLRLSLLLLGLSLLISISSAALQLHVVMDGMAFSVPRLLTLAFVQLWPFIVCVGLLWRWSRWRVAGAVLLWALASFALVQWRSIVPDARGTLLYLGVEGGPAILAAAVCLGGTARAIAPWLLLPMVGLVWASLTGLDLTTLMFPKPPAWFLWLVGTLGAHATMALFALAPWLLAWWPLKRLGRLLAHAYTRKWLSDLMVLFTAVWGISLLDKALMAASDLGLGGAVMLLPLLWVPLVMVALAALASRRRAPAHRPPTLLVLRVFQHDARTQALFDHVIERWRLSGNTVLIAGTDLTDRTLDADDIFTFIGGRLAERFIHQPADVAARLAAFDLAPDIDGRHRINECYCHDTTWQQALAALVQRSDVVLMDLRSFRAHNEGCRHELGVLARATRLQRVVVLTDGETDRAAARGAAAGAPAGRFVWLDTATSGRGKRREVLQSLFASDRPSAA